MKILDINGKPVQKLANYTNAHLYQLFEDFNQLNRGLLGVLLKSKLREFYANNLLRYNTILETLSRIEEDYFEMVDDPKAIRGKRPKVEKIEEEGKGARMVAVLLEGKTLEEYQVEMNEYMQQPTVIVL